MGFFAPGTPLATSAGMAALTDPRSLEAAKRAIAASRYNGETVAFLQPTDIGVLDAAASVMVDLMRRLGITVEQIQTDWASLSQRRTRRGPVSEGGMERALYGAWGRRLPQSGHQPAVTGRRSQGLLRLAG